MRQMLAPLSPAERLRRDVECVWQDVGPWIGRSLDEHAEASVAVIRLADASLDGSPKGESIRRAREERSPESEALCLRLVARHRR